MKNVLIIGASGDIGRATVKKLAEENSDLSFVLHYHKNKSSIVELTQQLKEEQVLQVIQADLSTNKGAVSLSQQILYPIHAVIFVSGLTQHGLFQDMSQNDMDDMINVHVKSPWLIIQHVLPTMLKQKKGKIIYITSIWGDTGASHEVIYSSVKGAQNSFIKALAKEVGSSGISVNGISPGFVETKMNEHLARDEREDIVSQIPLQRPALPEDIAHSVQFLMDDDSNYILGEIINVTGGWH